MTFYEFPFIYNLLIKNSDFLINEFIIILKLRINKINVINTNKNSNKRKIKTFFYIFYKIFSNFNEKKAKKILAENILNKKVIKFLKIIIILFLDINVLSKSLNTKAKLKYSYFMN